MKNIKFNVDNTTIKIIQLEKLKVFDNDKKVYAFLIEIESEKENIHFIFYESINFTDEIDIKKRKGIYGLNKKEIKDLIYSVLCCINMDYYSDVDSLNDFINEYGYEYNKNTEMLYNRVLEQKNKLHKVFTEKQIKYFDENNNILKDFIDNLKYEKYNKDLI